MLREHFLLVPLVYLLFIADFGNGCHKKRRKRAAPDPAVNLFFDTCLGEKSSDAVTWASIVDAVILHTSWYENSDEGQCSSATPSNTDEAECWKDALDNLITPTSDNLIFAKECVEEYVAMSKRKKREIFESSEQLPPFIYGPPLDNDDCPSVDPGEWLDVFSNSEIPQLHEDDRTLRDFGSFIEFVQKNALCGINCDECNVNYTSVFQPIETLDCNECWPTRLAGMLKSSSPLKTPATQTTIELQSNDPPGPTEIDCGSKYVKIEVGRLDTRRLKLEYNERLVVWGSDVEDINEIDEECRSVDQTDFHFNQTNCQPIIQTDTECITLTYTIRKFIFSLLGQTIQRYYRGCFNVTCKFQRTETVDTGPIHTLIKKLELPPQLDDAEFKFDLNFYDDNFENPLPDDSTVCVPDYVYVRGFVYIIGVDYFALQALRCWATEEEPSGSSPSYSLIEDGCPVTDVYGGSNSIVIVENGISLYIKFKFKSFVWLGVDKSYIYVHCNVRVCNTNEEECAFDCSKRRRRRDERSVDDSVHLSVGPIRIQSKQDPCELDNGGCSDVCEYDGHDVTCRCQTGRILYTDGKSCIEVDFLKSEHDRLEQDGDLGGDLGGDLDENVTFNHLVPAVICLNISLLVAVLLVVGCWQRKKFLPKISSSEQF